jgi:IMP cyclohydrolase
MYRVSSRSFPNRVISDLNGSLAVIPAEGHHQDIYSNPYISYNCLRHNERYSVVGNGTHTDPVYEKLESGVSMRDALASVLLAMDFEHDDYSTPRIAAIADRSTRMVGLGVVRPDGVESQVIELEPGTYHYLATYERNRISSLNEGSDLDINEVDEASSFILSKGHFANFTNAVSSAAALEGIDGFVVDSLNLGVGY